MSSAEARSLEARPGGHEGATLAAGSDTAPLLAVRMSTLRPAQARLRDAVNSSRSPGGHRRLSCGLRCPGPVGTAWSPGGVRCLCCGRGPGWAHLLKSWFGGAEFSQLLFVCKAFDFSFIFE